MMQPDHAPPPTLLILPHFLRRQVAENLPHLVMNTHYQVEYENHVRFRGGASLRHRSPVKIFTNISGLRRLKPPGDYRFCELCDCYVASDNRHCTVCNACTSMDGRQWNHCDLCKKCVKQSWCHCFSCGFCHLPSHGCRVSNPETRTTETRPGTTETRPGTAETPPRTTETTDFPLCHRCSSPGHKRRHCPLATPTTSAGGGARRPRGGAKGWGGAKGGGLAGGIGR
ncbi:uncharacterized protein LOC116938393 [Petromyzon marinus]|uniref:uncharacterized protein LOC116938393 n=1 Tax=Petromyzon marinus TaxID=7757 RepID=UPI003F7123B2